MRFYLLPEDVDLLIEEVGRRIGCRLWEEKSKTYELSEIGQTTAERAQQLGALKRYGRCYLTPSEDVQVKRVFIPAQGYWFIDLESEVIEFDGCPYDEFFLVQGRLYYQTDLVAPAKDAIIPKSKEFVSWAEQVFRNAKRVLKYDKALMAYVGPSAAVWQRQGGRFLESEAGMPRDQPAASA